jgi:hypothetical protein
LSENCPEVEDCPVNALIKHFKTYRSEDGTLYYIYLVKVCEYDINGAYLVVCFDGEVEKTCFASLDFSEALEFVRNKLGGEKYEV